MLMEGRTAWFEYRRVCIELVHGKLVDFDCIAS